MPTRETIQIGNPILAQKAKSIKEINSKETKNIITDITDTMREEWLIGLAANQIGILQRVFITEIRETANRSWKEADPLRIYINPKITWFSKKEITMYEWCGSVAYSKLFAPVKRPEKVTIQAYDQAWEEFKLKAEWLLARVIQHEYDHLNWIMFTEKITDIKKIMSSGEYRKIV